MTTVELRLQNVSVSLGSRQIIKDISFNVGAGEFVVLLGPNGAGKSTLLKALAALIPVSGRIDICSSPLNKLSLRSRAERIAYLPQNGDISWGLTVRETIGLGRFAAPRRSDHKAAIENAIAECGLTDLSEQSVHEISGGEKARVLLGRMLCAEAPVLLADEPVASLDPEHQLSVMRILRDKARQGRIVIAAIHDVALATRFATRAVCLKDGHILGDGDPGVLLRQGVVGQLFGLDYEWATTDSGEVVPVACLRGR
jgi:iron complex transport system ATP-binding protein